MSTTRRLLLSLLFGLLMGLSLPMRWGHWVPPNLGFLAWVALVPLIIAVRGLRPWRAWQISFAGALLGHTFIVYWIYTALNTYGHLSVAASVFVLSVALVAMAAITAATPAIVCFIETRTSAQVFSAHPHMRTYAQVFSAHPHIGTCLWAWPLAWAAVEYLRNFGPVGGFTFCNLIHSQYQYPLCFQIVNVVGPYWFLAIMVLVNVLIAHAILFFPYTRTHAHTHRFFPHILPLIVIFTVLLSYGLYSRHHYKTAVRHWPWLRVALVQGNIPQEEKWDEGRAEANFNIYRKASQEAMASHPDLIIWPEASYPWTIDLQTQTLPSRDQFSDTPILFGAVTRKDHRHFNSALLLNESGAIADVVHKYHLVPYGEYVPYKKYLQFLEGLTSVAGDMEPGAAIRPLLLDGMPLGILVCYEDTFPEIARTLVREGSVLLVNITNDAWYGWSPAATQHLAASVFRAAENGRTLVRATNTGVSAVIGPDGGIQLASSLYEPAVILSGVRLGVEATLYNRWGQGLDLGLPIILVVAVAYATFWGKPRSKQQPSTR